MIVALFSKFQGDRSVQPSPEQPKCVDLGFRTVEDGLRTWLVAVMRIRFKQWAPITGRRFRCKLCKTETDVEALEQSKLDNTT